MSELMKLPRAEKLGIARALASRLDARLAQGAPPDPVLNGFHVEINDSVLKLGTHVDGAAAMKGAHAALLIQSDECDDGVDCWFRKIHGVLDAEGLRRTGASAPAARELCKAAFPRGLEPIYDRVVDENSHCRSAIEVLKAHEHAPLLAAIAFPAGWVDGFEAAVNKSDEAYEALVKAKADKREHIEMGQNGEEEWEDLMIRYRHYLAGWAKKGDVLKRNEGRTLLEPLLDAVRKMRAAAAARATLKTKKVGESAGSSDEGASPEVK